MTNTRKAKGDRAERDAVTFLQTYIPHLLVDTPQRKLGAGRLLDTGDLDVFSDVVVQVKNHANFNSALRLAAEGAAAQAMHARAQFGIGMVMLPRLPITDHYRWIFVGIEWPTNDDYDANVKTADDLLVVLRATKHREMLVKLERGDRAPLLASWIDRWAHDYQAATSRSTENVR
ncbi:hypothetical protein [Ferrimicrobium acidiphilum]|uniref:hypothetical protein n=1 Tax=Ferrimicrobium acidiphilum TaxID=121039 RepID=UPI0023F347B2|nr:hypothetical protein [Ferrimicrobium acidiphilum]